MTAKKTKLNKIPEFKSIQEEAEFWDTHSFADYWNEFQPAKVKFDKPLGHILEVCFDGETLTRLEKEAAKKGISPATLVCVWMKERLFT